MRKNDGSRRNFEFRSAVAKNPLDFVAIYTDGACSGNPGPGGWAAVLVTPEAKIIELGGGEKPTTNNRMEVRAALEGLKRARLWKEPVKIYTDSTYLIRGITQWIWGWRRKGWVTADGKDVLNRDLFEELARVLAERGAESPVEWQYVRGHTGNPGNERCDEIAVAFSQGRYESLYSGPLKGYGIAVLDFPEAGPLPEMRPKEEKKVAYSYLSMVDGVPMRHKDWPSCERRVKGRSGAKFKKAMSAAEESAILGDWGVSPGRLKDG